MRLVRYENEDGFLRQGFIKENMPASDADKGIEYNPPDLNRIDWDAVKREINNDLIKVDLITLKDVAKVNSPLSNIILSAIRPKLIQLYKEQSGYKKNHNNKSLNGTPIKEANSV